MNTVVTDPADIYQLLHEGDTLVAVPDRANHPTGWLASAAGFTTIELIEAAGRLAAAGWKNTRFELVDHAHEPFEAAHDEAYRQILTHDLEVGGADKVNATLIRELPEVYVAAVRAVKGYGQTDRYGRLYDDGLIHSDHIEDFAAALGATVELTAAA